MLVEAEAVSQKVDGIIKGMRSTENLLEQERQVQHSLRVDSIGLLFHLDLIPAILVFKEILKAQEVH